MVLIKHAFAVFKAHASVLISIMVLPVALQIAVSFGNLYVKAMHPPTSPSIALFVLVLALVNIFVSIISGAALIYASVEIIEQRTVTAEASYRRAFSVFGPFLWLSILQFFVVIGGYALLIVPGIIFSLWFIYSTMVFFSNNQRGITAMQTSRAYMQGYIGPVFGRGFIFGLIIGIPVLIIFGFAGGTSSALGIIVIGIVTLILQPVALLFSAAIFKQLKDIKGPSPMI